MIIILEIFSIGFSLQNRTYDDLTTLGKLVCEDRDSLHQSFMTVIIYEIMYVLHNCKYYNLCIYLCLIRITKKTIL